MAPRQQRLRGARPAVAERGLGRSGGGAGGKGALDSYPPPRPSQMLFGMFASFLNVAKEIFPYFFQCFPFPVAPLEEQISIAVRLSLIKPWVQEPIGISSSSYGKFSYRNVLPVYIYREN